MLKAISLFSGAGGMDVGVKKAGFEVIAASELDPYACQTYRKNHPDSELFEGNIDDNIEDICKYKDIDLIFGGPPCQGFSIAGKMDACDPRSKLVFSFCSVVERIKPRAFIMENVKALGVLGKFQNIREEIYCRMGNAGYSVATKILNAKEYGLPQSRERVFFIGVLKDNVLDEKLFETLKAKAPSVREAISHLGKPGTKRNPHITPAKITFAKNPVLRSSPYAGMLFNGGGRPINLDMVSNTLPASMGGNRTPIIDDDAFYRNKNNWILGFHKHISQNNGKNNYKSIPSRMRRLTIDEAKILQGFPEKYIFVGNQSKIFTQIGNAVPPALAEVVAIILKNSILNAKNR